MVSKGLLQGFAGRCCLFPAGSFFAVLFCTGFSLVLLCSCFRCFCLLRNIVLCFRRGSFIGALRRGTCFCGCFPPAGCVCCPHPAIIAAASMAARISSLLFLMVSPPFLKNRKCACELTYEKSGLHPHFRCAIRSFFVIFILYFQISGLIFKRPVSVRHKIVQRTL